LKGTARSEYCEDFHHTFKSRSTEIRFFGGQFDHILKQLPLCTIVMHLCSTNFQNVYIQSQLLLQSYFPIQLVMYGATDQCGAGIVL